MKNYNTDEIETIIKDLEENMGNLMDDGKRHLDESEAIRRDLDNHITLKETTALAKKLDFNLDGFKSTKYFYSDLFIIEESSFGEISRALPDVTLYKYNLDVKTHAGVIVVAAVDDAEKIQRVMRGVNASAIVIPPEFPKNRHLKKDLRLADRSDKQSMRSKTERLPRMQKTFKRSYVI